MGKGWISLGWPYCGPCSIVMIARNAAAVSIKLNEGQKGYPY